MAHKIRREENNCVVRVREYSANKFPVPLNFYEMAEYSCATRTPLDLLTHTLGLSFLFLFL